MGSSDPIERLLERIVAAKRRRVAQSRRETLVSALDARARRRTPRDLGAALAARPFAVIAETKKASPSAGLIRPDYDPAAIARGYEAAGAAAISVLTEESRFSGEMAHLLLVREAVSLPVLRKDFIVDEYQVHESAAAGADAVLLIARLLPGRELARLAARCLDLGLTPLVEVHAEEEVEAAVGSGARVIGINNRDLQTLSVGLETTFALKPLIPPDRIVVSESGIRNPADLDALSSCGVRAALVGERLLAEADPGRALAALIGGMAGAAAPGGRR
ncbi:MAG TPA: indole-3-glycerol phosphate synthase TrpC [bacterium]|nr:indole-3-glycerol phosphate synthase TrpC [bacterium]